MGKQLEFYVVVERHESICECLWAIVRRIGRVVIPSLYHDRNKSENN